MHSAATTWVVVERIRTVARIATTAIQIEKVAIVAFFYTWSVVEQSCLLSIYCNCDPSRHEFPENHSKCHKSLLRSSRWSNAKPRPTCFETMWPSVFSIPYCCMKLFRGPRTLWKQKWRFSLRTVVASDRFFSRQGWLKFLKRSLWLKIALFVCDEGDNYQSKLWLAIFTVA